MAEIKNYSKKRNDFVFLTYIFCYACPFFLYFNITITKKTLFQGQQWVIFAFLYFGIQPGAPNDKFR